MNPYLIFLLLFPYYVASQQSYSETYYPLINQAENAIIEEDYKEAYNNYNTAFSKVKYPLARDLFNAYTCKVLLKDFDGAKPLLLKLAAKGVSPELIESEEITFRIIDKWDSFKPIYLQIYENFTPSIQPDISNILENIRSKFPKIIRGEPTIEIKADNPVYISGESIKLFTRPEEQIRLDKILDSTGGFYEYQSGISDPQLLLDNVNSEVFRNWTEKIHSIFSGTTEVKKEIPKHFNTKTYIENGIENGKWHRDIVYRTLNQNLEHLGVQLMQVTIEESCLNLKQGLYYNLDEKKYIKSKADYTEDLDLILKKAMFKLSDNLFKLSFTWPIMHQTFPSCQTAEKALTGWSYSR